MHHHEHLAGRRRRAVTLVELAVAMAAASILALAVGSMVVYSYAAWRTNNDAVELNRDLTIALDMLGRSIRPASANGISNSASGIAIAGATANMSFQKSGRDLVYDPDTSIAGNEVTIIGGRVTTFAVTNAASGVGVFLVLEQGDERAEVDTVFAARN